MSTTKRLVCVSAIALAGLALPVHAVQSNGGEDSEPASEFTRIVRPVTGADSRIVPVHDAFATRHGRGWQERRFGPANQFRSLWGRGVPVASSADVDPAEALAIATRFWRDNPYLLPSGVSVADLVLAANEMVGTTRFVAHRQTVDGIPVVGTGIFVAITRGRISWIGIRCYSPPDGAADPRIDSSTADRLAVDELHSLGVNTQITHTRLVFLPTDTGGSFRLAFEVGLRAAVAGVWTVYVAADDGAVLAVRDERRFLQATVEVEHHDRHVGNPLTSGAASYIGVTSADGYGLADGQGLFHDSNESTTATLELRGAYAQVVDTTGGDLVVTTPTLFDGDTYLWRTSSSEFDQAQLDAYRFTVQAWDYAASLENGSAWLDAPIAVYVNMDYTCNAYYDGAINFFRSGDSCNNSAMIEDVVCHEFGHGFHIHSILPGVAEYYWDTGEAYADAMSFLVTGSSEIGPYFFTNGDPVRDVAPDRIYPGDIVDECHEDGLILGGALWDLRERLMADHGAENGAAVAGRLYGQALRTSTDMLSSYEAHLVADDDNGNLDDGTPNYCAINGAFSTHGLAATDPQCSAFSFRPIEHGVPAHEPQTIEVLGLGFGDGVGPSWSGQVRLAYSTTGGAQWEEQTLERTDVATFHGTLPGRPEGTTISYYIEFEDDQADELRTLPANPAEPYYQLYVGELETIHCDTFETETSPVWNAMDLSAESAGEDWESGQPTGAGGDPDYAYSGSSAWGNDLGASGDGLYLAQQHSALESPMLDLSDAHSVRLRFQRWLRVEDGSFDQASVEVNGVSVWSNHTGDGEVHHLDDGWIPVDLDISHLADGNGEVRIRWVLSADHSQEYGGWNIDDICLVGVTAEGADGPDGFERDDLWTGQQDTGVADVPPGAESVTQDCRCDSSASSREWTGPALVTLLAAAAGAGHRRRRGMRRRMTRS